MEAAKRFKLPRSLRGSRWAIMVELAPFIKGRAVLNESELRAQRTLLSHFDMRWVLQAILASTLVYRENEFFDIVYDEIGGVLSDDEWANMADYIAQMQCQLHQYIEPLIPEGHKDDEYTFHQWVDEDDGVAIVRHSEVPSGDGPDGEGERAAIW